MSIIKRYTFSAQIMQRLEKVQKPQFFFFIKHLEVSSEQLSTFHKKGKNTKILSDDSLVIFLAFHR